MNDTREYLKWRGDIELGYDGVNAVDALVFSQLSYLHLGEAAPGKDGLMLAELMPMMNIVPMEPGNPQTAQNRREIGTLAAQSRRMGGLRMEDYEDVFQPQDEKQFAAFTLVLPDGSRFVNYRGTDATIVGWREDFNMSFECPVPAQQAALEYLKRLAARTEGPLYLGGHSKGGNLAVYAGACCDETIRHRLKAVYTFDGPGLDEPTAQTEGYRALLPLIQRYVPQTSIIGMLMCSDAPCTVVHSVASGLSQHDTFSWDIEGTGFLTLPATTTASRFMNETVDDWLKTSTKAMRSTFVDALFDVMDATNARTLGELRQNLSTSLSAMLTATRNIDAPTRKVLVSVLTSLMSSGAASVVKLWSEHEDEKREAKAAEVSEQEEKKG